MTTPPGVFPFPQVAPEMARSVSTKRYLESGRTIYPKSLTSANEARYDAAMRCDHNPPTTLGCKGCQLVANNNLSKERYAAGVISRKERAWAKNTVFAELYGAKQQSPHTGKAYEVHDEMVWEGSRGEPVTEPIPIPKDVEEALDAIIGEAEPQEAADGGTVESYGGYDVVSIDTAKLKKQNEILKATMDRLEKKITDELRPKNLWGTVVANRKRWDDGPKAA